MRKIFLLQLIAALILAIVSCGCSIGHYNASRHEAAPVTAIEQTTPQLEAIFDPSKTWPQIKSDLEPDPSVIYGTLNNGFRYVLMKNAKPEQRIQMHLFVQTGSMDESDAERGLAHFLEHLEFCGSEHFEPGELVKYFQSIGMQFGADANAGTSFYSTVYDIDLPETDSESMKKGLLVIRDFAAGALIQPSEVDRERSVVLAEKRTRDSADYRIYEKSVAFELPDALISKRLPIGETKVLEQADRQTIKSFYDAWYRPERMILIMVGDFDTKTASEMIKDRFSDIAPHAPERSYPDPGRIDHHGIQPFYYYEPEAGNTSVSIEVITKHIDSVDSKNLERQDLLSAMANSIINNRLSEMIEKPDTPFTQASISSGNYLQYVQSAEINADCSAENWQKTLSTMEQTLRQALQYGFTPPEIDIVKKDFIAQLDKAVLTESTRDSQNIAHQIIYCLNDRKVFQSPEQRKELFAPIIETVTENDLHQALKNDWAPDQRLILVTGNLNLSNQNITPEQQILDTYTFSFKQPVEKTADKNIITFPYLPVPEKKGIIANREDIADLGITRIEFENGVQLNIKKTDFKAGEVAAAVVFGNGRSSEPKDKPGLAQLSQRVINLSGLGQMSRDELQKALAGKNTGVSFQAGEDHFALAGSSISSELPLLFQLYQAYIDDPGFREDAYALAMQQFDQEYQSFERSIDGGMMLKGARFLAGGDSRFGLPEYDAFKTNSLDDVRKWAGDALANDPLEISIVGDLDVDSIIDLAATYFGSLPKRAQIPQPNESQRPKFPAGESLIVSVPTQIQKGRVDVAYPTDDYWDIRRNRRLSLLSDVFSDRMRIRIRDEMGAAYALDAYNDPSRAYPGYGVLHSVVLIAPAQKEPVIAAVKDIANDIAQNGVKSDEFQRAAKPVLEKIKEMVKTNAYWLNNVLTDSNRHPEQLDWSRSFQSDYASIVPEELSGLAKEYLKNQATAIVVIVPKKTAGENTGVGDASQK